MDGRGVVWYRRKIVCRNGVEEVSKYPVAVSRRETASRTARRDGRSMDSAERTAARLLNNNFDAHRDLHLGLEYSGDGMKLLTERVEKLAREHPEAKRENLIVRAAKKEAENWVRRVQRALGKEIQFRYLLVTSDMDGETGEPVRIHHHVIVNAEAREACVKKWQRMGFVKEMELYTVNMDFTPLAAYLMKQVRYIPDEKRYTPSRNLVQPVIEEPVPVTRYIDSELKVPAGCIALHRNPYTRGAAQYLRYYRPPERRRESGRKIRKRR